MNESNIVYRSRENGLLSLLNRGAAHSMNILSKTLARPKNLRAGGNTVMLGASIVIGMAALCGAMFSAFSQQLSEAGINLETRSHDIVSHLNAVIRFYRASTQSIQKAGEPNDVVYRDQAVAQATEIAILSFQSAKAEAALIAKDQTAQTGSQEGNASGEQQRLQSTEENVEQQIG